MLYGWVDVVVAKPKQISFSKNYQHLHNDFCRPKMGVFISPRIIAFSVITAGIVACMIIFITQAETLGMDAEKRDTSEKGKALVLASPQAQINEMTRQTHPDTAVPDEHAPTTLPVLTTGKSQSIATLSAATVPYLLLALIIFSVMKCLLFTAYKRVHGHLPMATWKGCDKQEERKLLANGENPDNDSIGKSVIHILETIPEGLNLSELPPGEEDSLVMLLDVEDQQQVAERDKSHVVGHRLYKYWWQKIGQEFKISKEKLRYLELQYKQDNGSPTKKLFEILGSQGKTVSELISVLEQRPTVNPPNFNVL